MPTTKLDIDYIASSQAQKEVTANDAFDILDAQAGRIEVATTGGTTNLTQAQGRSGLIELTGTLASNATIVYPTTLDGKILILNKTTGNFTVKVKRGTGTEYEIPQNMLGMLWQQGFQSIGRAYIVGTEGYVRQHDGTTLKERYIGVEATRPTAVSTWTARGTAFTSSLDNADGTILFQQDPTAGHNCCMRTKAIPAGDFTLDFEILLDIYNEATSYSGVCFLEQSTGKIINIGYERTGGFSVVKWNSNTSFNAQYTFRSVGFAPRHFLRLQRSGTNLNFALSYNGTYYRTIWGPSAQNNFFTTAPEEYGIFANANNSNTPVAIKVLSVRQS